MSLDASSRENTALGLSFKEVLTILWSGRWIIALSTIISGIIAFAYLKQTPKIFRLDALVQVEEKQNSAGAMFGELGEMLDVESPAETEIEIIKSRMVLGKAAQELLLDVRVWTEGKETWINSLGVKKHEIILDPKAYLQSIKVSRGLLGKAIRISSARNDVFHVTIDEAKSQRCHAGIICQIIQDADTAWISLAPSVPKAEGEFLVKKIDPLVTVNALAREMKVSEKGKKTGILLISFTSKNSDEGARILNKVVDCYLAQNVERKSAEAQQTLNFLAENLPILKLRSEELQERLNAYRLQVGSIDLTQESKLLLDQNVEMEAQVVALKQKKDELLRLYREDHPAVQTLELQKQKIESQIGGIRSGIRKLPGTQQEVLRLTQESRAAADLYNEMLRTYQQLEVAKAGQVGNVRVIDYALPTPKPIFPNRPVVVVALLFFGMLVGSVLVLGKNVWFAKMQDFAAIEGVMALPILATIPHSILERKRKSKKIRTPQIPLVLSHSNPDDLAVEGVRSLQTRLHFSLITKQNNVIAVLGPAPNIGKSFVSMNLAVVMAQSGKRVCLIDGDLRRGELHVNFGLDRSPGVTEIIVTDLPKGDVFQQTQISNLWVVTSGERVPNPSALLFGKRLQDLVEDAARKFDFVIIDTPPVLAVADALVFSKYAGTNLMVIGFNNHHEKEIERSLAIVKESGISVDGAIVNNVKLDSAVGYSYSYHAYSQST